jgi:hypothetical protein
MTPRGCAPLFEPQGRETDKHQQQRERDAERGKDHMKRRFALGSSAFLIAATSRSLDVCSATAAFNGPRFAW